LLLAERGVIVSYESVRRWCLKFGRSFADKLRRRPRPGDTWHLDEVFLRINGEQHYLWRAVDQSSSTFWCRIVETPLPPNASSSAHFAGCSTNRGA
jgi:transposase-like protein